MKKNLFIKVMLLVIASLLAINLIVLFGSPSTSHAVGHIQYKVVAYMGHEDDARQMESLLNTFANDGWELVTLEPVFGSFIFKK